MKAVLLDRDGTINHKPHLARYVRKPSELRWLPGALKALALLKKAGYKVIVVTNQAGIGKGVMSRAAVDEVHAAMRKDAARAGGRIDAFYVCPHKPDAGCACRKPEPGLLRKAKRDFNLDFSRTPFVGDSGKDVEAGKAVGCPTYRVSGGWNLLKVVQRRILAGDGKR